MLHQKGTEKKQKKILACSERRRVHYLSSATLSKYSWSSELGSEHASSVSLKRDPVSGKMKEAIIQYNHNDN